MLRTSCRLSVLSGRSSSQRCSHGAYRAHQIINHLLHIQSTDPHTIYRPTYNQQTRTQSTDPHTIYRPTYNLQTHIQSTDPPKLGKSSGKAAEKLRKVCTYVIHSRCCTYFQCLSRSTSGAFGACRRFLCCRVSRVGSCAGFDLTPANVQ